jgi:hypothetical protein
MLDFLKGRTSEKKLRHFACACCRRIWPKLSDKRSRNAVEVAEHYAEGVASEEELRFAYCQAYDVARPSTIPDIEFWQAPPLTAAEAAMFAASPCTDAADQWFVYDTATAAASASSDHKAERIIQCGILREIVGNPFLSELKEQGQSAL